MQVVIYVLNRILLTNIDNMTLHEKLFGNHPNIFHLHEFRSVCFVHYFDTFSKKLDKKSIKWMFYSYDEAKKCWRHINSKMMKILRTLFLMRHLLSGILMGPTQLVSLNHFFMKKMYLQRMLFSQKLVNLVHFLQLLFQLNY